MSEWKQLMAVAVKEAVSDGDYELAHKLIQFMEGEESHEAK